MIHEQDTLTVETEQPREIRDITPRLKRVLNDSGVKDGMVSVFPLHTSCSVFINDSDPNLLDDVETVLEQLVPEGDQYQHNKTDPKQNATAHIKSILTGHHVTIPVSGGTFDFGRYHTVYYAEFDGERSKELLVTIMGQR